MSDDVAKCATPNEELERQIMSSLVPKNEREHWAAREINRLRIELDRLSGELTRLSSILEKERVVQRRIHRVFNHLTQQVALGWESCLESFGMRDKNAG